MSVPIAVSLVRELAGFAAASLEPRVVGKAQLCLVDFLSCAYAGRRLPYAQQAIAAARPWALATGAPIIATELRVAPGEAAYVNSLMAASASRTDMHPASTSHPAAVIFPVAFACAALKPVTGRHLLAAVVAGYEAMGRLGRIVVNGDFKTRFRSTSVIGTVGGAITAARLLGLTEAQAVNTLSIAANAAAGLMEWGHSGELDLFQQPANASRAVVGAALLAREGATSSPTILEGPGGFLNAFGGRARAGELLQRGEGWEIEQIEYKPVAACVFVQAAAAAAERVIRDNGDIGRQVEGVTLRTFASAIAYPGCDNAGPIDAMQPARMSLQYTVASVLARADLSDRTFVEIDDPLTRELSPRIELEESAEFTRAFPARQGAELEVRLREGRTLTARVDEVPVFTPEHVLERFRRVAQHLFDPARVESLERACRDCANLARVDELFSATPP
jgi:2-methylcitrate dehydratase PrpD